MGILFTILMGFLFTITMGILFTIVLGIQFTVSTSEELVAAIRAIASGSIYLSPGIAGLRGRHLS